ncbi:hypothetical protein EVAR_3335_1 [Eumeta japonica]|uniref:Uncharacterized protein n=1 Tax=Eumeta variegata TaxID=151549 RepID=A0A4C1SSS7_EUMVA|nr:hypothetical protein EVAR_3335_1 [Eumeta japonica]
MYWDIALRINFMKRSVDRKLAKVLVTNSSKNYAAYLKCTMENDADRKLMTTWCGRRSNRARRWAGLAVVTGISCLPFPYLLCDHRYMSCAIVLVSKPTRQVNVNRHAVAAAAGRRSNRRYYFKREKCFSLMRAVG